MFENLLGQDEIKSSLTRSLEHDEVPPVYLFAGPPMSGKMTAALETARVMSCTRSAAWDCDCSDCIRHRSLVHPDLLILGKRNHPEEILVAKDLILRDTSSSSLFFFVRSIRKLLARFSPVLWEGEESKLSKAAPLVQSIEEELATLEEASTVDPARTKLIDVLCEDSLSLEALAPEFPPVFMIRNMETWAQLKPLGRRKTVILENAERMQDSARNAMLKILEEPPESTRFILLTTRRASMMSTIVSRSRVLHFKPRDEATTKLIVRRVFKNDPQAAPETLQEFFDAKRPYSSSAARKHAELLTGLILANCDAATNSTKLTEKGWKNPAPGTSLALVEAALDAKISIQECIDQIIVQTSSFGSKDKAFSGSFVQLLQAMLSCFAGLLVDSGENPLLLALVDRWSCLVRDASREVTTYNRNPELLLRVLVDSCIHILGEVT